MNFDPRYSGRNFSSVGTRPIRPDGVDKVTGRARYGADFNMTIVPDRLEALQTAPCGGHPSTFSA